MASTVVELNLPPPPAQVQPQLLDYLNQVPLDPDRKRWLDEFHHKQINSVLHLFFEAPEPWQALIQDLYQKYFPRHDFSVAFGIMTNTDTVPACLPPHTDRARGLAINYYLQLGGADVNTVFYSQTSKTQDSQATNFLYNESGAITNQKIFEQKWYAYNVNQAHSVEGISTTRFILALLIDNATSTYQLEDLIRDYPNLIQDI